MTLRKKSLKYDKTGAKRKSFKGLKTLFYERIHLTFLYLFVNVPEYENQDATTMTFTIGNKKLGHGCQKILIDKIDWL